jgi:hypothetical protein
LVRGTPACRIIRELTIRIEQEVTVTIMTGASPGIGAYGHAFIGRGFAVSASTVEQHSL